MREQSQTANIGQGYSRTRVLQRAAPARVGGRDREAGGNRGEQRSRARMHGFLDIFYAFFLRGGNQRSFLVFRRVPSCLCSCCCSISNTDTGVRVCVCPAPPVHRRTGYPRLIALFRCPFWWNAGERERRGRGRAEEVRDTKKIQIEQNTPSVLNRRSWQVQPAGGSSDGICPPVSTRLPEVSESLRAPPCVVPETTPMSNH